MLYRSVVVQVVVHDVGITYLSTFAQTDFYMELAFRSFLRSPSNRSESSTNVLSMLLFL